MELIIGKNDFVTRRSYLLDRWDFEKNKINPNNILYNSPKSVYWICEKGHSYREQIMNMKLSYTCPICSGREVVPGINDLKTVYPKLALEYHPTKNQYKIEEISFNFGKGRLWWLGKCGHEWKATINSRVKNKNGCPFCEGRRVLIGFNDLVTTNSEILKFWDYEKNEKLPNNYLSTSTEKVWWYCINKGHKFEQPINERIINEVCPHCIKNSNHLYPEKIVYYYVKRYFKDAINNYIFEGKELDVYIPSLNLAIEYDGGSYHKHIKKDIDKNKLTESKNVRLIRIREPNCPLMSRKVEKIILKDKSMTTLTKGIEKLLQTLNIEKPIINILEDSKEIEKC